jgi:hypothetical protein
MTDTTSELHVEIVKILKADLAVQAIFADRVYDAVPATVLTPYIRVGEFLPTRDLVDCINAYEVYYDVHVWTAEGKGLNHCRRCCIPVINALDGATIDAVGVAVVDNTHRATRAFRDADGKTHHGILNFRAQTEF